MLQKSADAQFVTISCEHIMTHFVTMLQKSADAQFVTISCEYIMTDIS